MSSLQRGVVAFVAGLAVTLALAFVFHRVILRERFDAIFAQLGGEPHPPSGVAMYAIVVAVTIYLFPKVSSGRSSILDGYKLGAVLGLVFIAPLAAIFVRMGIPPSTIVLDVLWHTFVEHPVAGAVIGVICGNRKVVDGSAP